MQATVSHFDSATGSGSVLLDDGVELPFAAEALDGSGLRLLRPGQRVRIVTEGASRDLRVRQLQIVTLA
jgi:2-phospho-L-lactate guanylyltransferase